ncbi:hypothetical protein BN1232_06411 [Mycobacterium lentiflavum]|uniref:Uncharacterized protein n=2 Tax=Mycobacterium simiae complex TaxID=2249310 RepID=A0A0E4H2E7_MYCLN|nr:hypothetical protein [Mycobacterium lentiflavum]CQD24847.1 hypothetical protein BN1232_06411 [Mycobacterium lentiflavum]
MMTKPAPTWMTPLPSVVTILAMMVAGVMIADIDLGGGRPPLPAMEAGWPISAISISPPAGGSAGAKEMPSQPDVHAPRFVVANNCPKRKGRRPRQC